ncbi:GerAB/ArcD/ProY family transporter [Halobacillus rhizosphaerae]|uniref:GerAB/ArcD/ProY family transporter n=1 Tax=Halobacillus rhizosphaerae TaxID=3064889 RepID=UPI00398B1DA5
MKINLTISSDQAVQAFYVFFIVHTLQIGAGLMGVPRILFVEAESDAWISIIIASLCIHFVVWIMLLILKEYESADILGIQEDVFGKWIGRLISSAYLVYLFSILLAVLKNYIEVVQVFVLPEMSTWLMSLFLIFLVVYSLLGGFRVMVGVSFLFFFGTIWLVFSLYKPLSLMDWSHFTPIGIHSYMDILRGAFKMSYSVLGFEVLFFIYPYIRNKKDIHLPLHAGIFLTNLLIFLVTVVSIGYFSPGQLKESVWATLSLFKIIHFSFIERFDVLAVSLWMTVILPNLIIFFWMIIRIFRRSFNAPEKPTMYTLAVCLFIASMLIEYRINIDKLTDFAAKSGFYLVFIYPLILYPIVKIKKRLKKGHSS